MIKTLKEINIFENRFWKFNNNKVLFNGKHEGEHIKMKSKGGHGVAILPIDSEGYIHIQDEFRYGIDSYMTHVAMGGIKENYTKEEAALEELEEEMGLSTNKLTPFGYKRELPNVMDHKCFLFVAEDVYLKNDKVSEITESFANKRKIHIEKAFEMAMNSEFECGTTQLLIIKYYLKYYKKN